MSDDLASGEIARWLERLDKGQEELLRRFDSVRAELVTRSEWDMQNRAHTRDIADVENGSRTLAARVEVIAEQVATHRDGMSRFKGVLWILGAILGVVVTIVTSYIQSGRL